MKVKSIIAVLLLMVAGLQTADAQGFRVYKSDGAMVQFSLRTDSIVFYDGLGSDEDFGPFTPVNQCIVGTWYKSKSESVTFREDGTTDYIEGATYEFMPYQGSAIIYNAGGVPFTYIRVLEVTTEKMVVNPLGSNSISVWTTTPQPTLAQEIQLSVETLTMKPDETTTLTATVLPVDADNPEVSWESSDEEVAEVSKKGMVIANAEGTCTITCRATDGSGVYAECEVTVEAPNTHEYVDLGLPSGTLWATCNIGASKPEEYGDYFAWGETTGYNGGKTYFDWSTYKYCNGSSTTITKYCTDSYFGTVDNKTELEPEDDAATANWGTGWKMPTDTQMQELLDNCSREWTTQGILVTGPNGGQIFLPAAGYRGYGYRDSAGYGGYYWTNSLYSGGGSASCLDFYSDGWHWRYNSRYNGRSVRPVRVLQTR